MCKERRPYSYFNTNYHIDIFVRVLLCLALLIWKSALLFRTEILFELLACMNIDIDIFIDEIYTNG